MCPKEKSCQLRILYLPKLSFKNKGEIYIFPDQQMLRKFIAGRPVLQEVIKGVLEKQNKRTPMGT